MTYGRIGTHTWGDEGARRMSVDLIVDDFQFADRAPAAGPSTDDAATPDGEPQG